MVIYAIKKMLELRSCLGRYLRTNSLQAPGLLALSPSTLQKSNIKAIILDFDGVLNYYHANEVAPAQYRWLQDCVAYYEAKNIFILSNKPSNTRRQYFAKHFPGVNFVVAKRKKPYPDGIMAIQQQTNFDPKSLLIIDDRLTTGILAACITGISGCYTTKPLVNYRKHPLAEIYFSFLRVIERAIIFVF